MLILAGLGALTQSWLIQSLFYIISGLVCLPPTLKMIEKKINFQFQSWHKYAIVIFSLVISGITIPESETVHNSTDGNLSSKNSSTSNTKENNIEEQQQKKSA